MLLDGMTERDLGMDLVVGSATAALAREVAAPLEVDDDSMSGPLRDADRRSQIAEAHLGVAGDGDQDVRVVGEERPAVVGERASWS